MRILGASTDGRGSAGEVRDCVEENGVTFIVLPDPGSRATRSLRTTGVPGRFLIGRAGTLLKRWIGVIRPEAGSVRGPIREALRKGADAVLRRHRDGDPGRPRSRRPAWRGSRTVGV